VWGQCLEGEYIFQNHLKLGGTYFGDGKRGYSFSFGVFMQHRSLQKNKEIKSQKLLLI
jgi:hypothetical protein